MKKELKRSDNDAKGDEFIAVLSQVKDTVSKLSAARNETIQQLIELKKGLKAAEEREKAREERDIDV